MKKQILLGMLGLLLASAGASAQNGFYGGVSMRDRGTESRGLILGGDVLAWGHFATPVTEDVNTRSLVYGGYRWNNDIAVQAVVNTSDKYALRPAGAPLTVAPAPGMTFGDVGSRSWNADVYTSWELIRRLSLYGRFGYAQSDVRPLFAGASLVQGDPRRQRDGVNYGVGLRYDVTHSLGLRFEYARFGRFAGETVGSSMPDSDQVSIGVQYRF